MRIFHFSDTHAAGPPSGWWAAFDKRVVGLFNHTYFRMHRHEQRLLSAIPEAVAASGASVVVCTGDITTSGEPSEFEAAAAALLPLAQAPGLTFIYSPGNHDAYVADPVCVKALRKAFSILNRGLDMDDLPAVISCGAVQFCLVNHCRPVHLLMSSGHMRPQAEERVLAWASSPAPRKILVGHYPYLTNNDIVRWRHRLYGGRRVAEAIRSRKIDLALCGHVHVRRLTLSPDGCGEAIAGSLTRNGVAGLVDVHEPGAGAPFSHSAWDIRRQEPIP